MSIDNLSIQYTALVMPHVHGAYWGIGVRPDPRKIWESRSLQHLHDACFLRQ